MIELLLSLLGSYLFLGFLFAVPFAILGAKRVDPGAEEGTWGFKLLIIPGTLIFWPLLLKRWMKGDSLPVERSAHRTP